MSSQKPKLIMPSQVFKWLSGDVNYADYGGKWIRCAKLRLHHVIELTNMDDACSRDNVGHPTYVVELSAVDLDEILRSTVMSALKSCEWELKAFSPVTLLPATVVNEADGAVVANAQQAERCIVEALHSYGAKAPLGHWSGNAYETLLSQAKAESKQLNAPFLYEERMCQPMNAIGTTAREAMQDDFDSAMQRSLTPSAQLTTVKLRSSGARRDSTDPITFMYGYIAAMQGAPVERNKDLAVEYTAGYQRGLNVRVGKAEPCDWINVKAK